jgi:hypothetical protein
MDRATYLDQTVARVQAAGYTLDPSSGPAQLVAYRSAFRWRWMATKLHTLVVVSTAPEVTAEGLAQFATSSLEWAKVAKGQMRGAQVGVAVIAAVVADQADESAVLFARKELVRGYAAFAWPVVVDLSSGQRTSHAGRPAIGAMYTGWMRQQITTLLPAPAEVTTR